MLIWKKLFQLICLKMAVYIEGDDVFKQLETDAMLLKYQDHLCYFPVMESSSVDKDGWKMSHKIQLDEVAKVAERAEHCMLGRDMGRSICMLVSVFSLWRS